MGRAQDTTSADGLMAAARVRAIEEKNNDDAIRLAKKALYLQPANTDVMVFIGRTYSWAGNRDSAVQYLAKAIQANNRNEDAYLAYVDAYFWSKCNEEALAIDTMGLAIFQESHGLRVRKAKILAAMGKCHAARVLADTMRRADRNDKEVRGLVLDIKDLCYHNRIGLKVDYARFDKQFPDDWRFAHLEYVNGRRKVAYVMRLNWADRFAQQGVQYEVDAYPKLSRKFYLYTNLGYSADAVIFPKWRSGLSLYANLPHAYEAEVGARYLYYTSSAVFYTAYAGKYYRSFLFGARTYLAPAATGFARSFLGTVRYYYGGTDDYVNFTASQGVSPDDRRYNLVANSSNQLSSRMAEVIVRHAIRRLNVVSVNFSIYQQELIAGDVGYQYQAGLGYIRRL